MLLADDARRLRRMLSGGEGDTGVPAEAIDEYVAVLSAPGALTAALNWYRAMSSTARVDPVGGADDLRLERRRRRDRPDRRRGVRQLRDRRLPVRRAARRSRTGSPSRRPSSWRRRSWTGSRPSEAVSRPAAAEQGDRLVGSIPRHEQVVVEVAGEDVAADPGVGEHRADGRRQADRRQVGVHLQRDPRRDVVVGQAGPVGVLAGSGRGSAPRPRPPSRRDADPPGRCRPAPGRTRGAPAPARVDARPGACPGRAPPSSSAPVTSASRPASSSRSTGRRVTPAATWWKPALTCSTGHAGQPRPAEPVGGQLHAGGGELGTGRRRTGLPVDDLVPPVGVGVDGVDPAAQRQRARAASRTAPRPRPAAGRPTRWRGRPPAARPARRRVRRTRRRSPAARRGRPASRRRTAPPARRGRRCPGGPAARVRRASAGAAAGPARPGRGAA